MSVGIGTVSGLPLASQPVAGFQRAEPSATLDKSFYIQLFSACGIVHCGILRCQVWGNRSLEIRGSGSSGQT